MAKIDKLARKFSGTDLKNNTKKSVEWFRKRLKNQDMSGKRLLNDDFFEKRKAPKVGHMYMYAYDAKHKATLPYYDRFPLIFMVGPAKKGFYGINLHYLPPKIRALFFNKLMSISSSKKYDEKTKLRISYDLLASVGKFKEFAPCFKHYLTKQVRSKLLWVPSYEWDLALFLPVADWIGARESTVWADTRRRLKA